MTRSKSKSNKTTTSYKTPIDLSFGYQNIDGIHSPSFGCKLPYLHSKFTHDFEILSESWGHRIHEKNVTGYKLICDIPPHKKMGVKKGTASGGILIFSKEEQAKYVETAKKTPRYVWIIINKSVFHNLKKSVKICVAYNPPENSKYCNKDFFSDLSQDLLQTSNNNSPLILLGDLNARVGELPDYEEIEEKYLEYTIGRKTFPTRRKNWDKTVNNMGQKLLEFCKSHDLQILNGRSIGDTSGSLTFYDTRNGGSAIDVAIASDPIVNEVKSFTVNNPTEYSSHCKIELRLKNILAIPEKEDNENYS